MKTIKFFAAALAIVAAASCAKEPISNENSDNNEQVLVHKVFSASLDSDESHESKTTLHTDGKTVHWTAGDQIKLIPAGGYQGDSFSIIESSINGTFADFEGETVDATSYRAVYPAGAYYESWSYSDQFTFNADAITPQYAVANNFSKNAYGCTNLSVSSTAKDEHLFFHNICAYLKLKVAADNVSSIEVTSSKVTSYSSGALESRGLGGSINYKPSTGLTYMSSNNNAIVFKNENETVLSTGVDYYIAIPAVQIKDLKLTFKASDGSMIGSLTKSDFTAAANTIYNLGSLNVTSDGTGGESGEVTPADELTVSTTNLAISNMGGSASFTINTNTSWSISTSATWLTISQTSGDAGTTTVKVTNNNANITNSENTAYLDIAAGTKKATVVVKQSKVTSYNRGEIVSKAEDLVHEQCYIIELNGSTGNYWFVNSKSALTMQQYSYPTGFNNQYIFVYHKDDSKGASSETNYNSKSTGTWKSVYAGKYMSTSFSFVTTADCAQYIAHSNRYGTETGSDMDFCKPNETNCLNYNNSKFAFGCTKESNRKWLIYKATPVN